MPTPTGKTGEYKAGVCPAAYKSVICGYHDAVEAGEPTYDCLFGACPMKIAPVVVQEAEEK